LPIQVGFPRAKEKGRTRPSARRWIELRNAQRKSLQNQPDVLADVLLTIGAAYQSMAQFELAEKYMRRSADLNRQTFGDNSVQAARATNG